MKKVIFKTMYTATILLAFLFCGLISASAIDVEYCIEEAVKVADYTQLKNALQNFVDGQNIVLTNNIEINDDNNDCSINIKNYGVVALELNGKKITVNSKATKYLFNITGNTKLFFINSDKSNSGNINFNSTKSGSALIYINNANSKIYNINVKFNMGLNSGYSASDTSVFCVNKGAELNLFGGVINNDVSGGDGVKVMDSATKLKLKIGGNAEIEANRYPVVFNSEKIKSVLFGSSKFESDTNSERIKVQSGCSLTVGDLWNSSNSSYQTTVYKNSITPVSKNLKITSLDKADITAEKKCEFMSGTKFEIILNYSGGHVRVCAICYMAFHDILSHKEEDAGGVAAGCTTPGKTSGYTCKECSYSSRTTTPPKGHSIVYKAKVAGSCGVNGMQEHYYCSSCGSYFTDKDGKNKVSSSSLIIINKHETEVIPGVAATCNKEGLSSGLKCKNCSTVIQAQTVLPKLSHDYPDNWRILVNATCQYSGIKEKVCTVCGNRLTESISRFPHDYNTEGKCVDCGKDINDPEPGPDTDPTPDPNPNPNPDPDQGSDSDKVDCSCSCHKEGLKKFLFKIILFFQRIFKLNQYCKGCGVAHY